MTATNGVSPQIQECLGGFLDRYPRYFEPAHAASQCSIAASDLVAYLAEQGHAARTVWVRHPRNPFSRAQRRALAAKEHAVVELPTGTLIDFTRRQYDPAADVPTLYASEESLARHWEQINDHEFRDAAWRALGS